LRDYLETSLQANAIALTPGTFLVFKDQDAEQRFHLIWRLPAVLRIYIGCAGVLYGDMALADVVKIHMDSGKVTVIRCDDFSLPLPRIVQRVKVNLRHQDVRVFSYGEDSGLRERRASHIPFRNRGDGGHGGHSWGRCHDP